MSSFLQRARDRAQEAAAHLTSGPLTQPQLGTDAHHAPSDGTPPPLTTSSLSSSSSSSSGFTYKGSLPHAFRAGLASVDPRFEATRSLHVMRGSLKAIIIDEAALSRETKTAAAKVFKWGSDHKTGSGRLDGVGDDVLSDITDRLAFMLSTIGDLEQEHSDRLANARNQLKEVQTVELELAGKRVQRVKIVKELQTLLAERVLPGPSGKADQLSAYLSQLQQEAESEEKALSRLKRQRLQACFDAQFDSYIAHGEKMALVASYGKLLMQQVPVDELAEFPAPQHGFDGWRGSAQTAQIRSLVETALKAYAPRTPIPTLPLELTTAPPLTSTSESKTSDDASTGVASFLSFGHTHAHELARDEEVTASLSTSDEKTVQAKNPMTPLPTVLEKATSGDAPALPPRPAAELSAVLPTLPSNHGEGSTITSSTSPPVLTTKGPVHRLPPVGGNVHSPPNSTRSVHRVPPPLTSSSTAATNYWDPAFLASGFTESSAARGPPYAIILLNQTIAPHQKELFKSIWIGAQVRICADGGGNHLLSTFGGELASTVPLPHAVVGDFDSLSSSSRSFYTMASVPLSHEPSQYATDLGKSIQWLEDWEQSRGEKLELVIFGGVSGRVDQTAHTLHVLWKLCPTLPSLAGYEDPSADASTPEGRRGGKLEKRNKTWIVGDESLVYLIPPGVHKLRHPRPALGVCCGVLPFGVAATGEGIGAKVKTQGLEWDLDPSQPQSMGGYLSTSNHVLGTDSTEVTLETDKPIYWSIELASSHTLHSSTASAQQVRRRSSIAKPAGLIARTPSYSSGSHARRSSQSGLVPGDNSVVEVTTNDSAPPGPTVAETGEVIPSSPTGPGPLSGTLQPRRSRGSSNAAAWRAAQHQDHGQEQPHSPSSPAPPHPIVPPRPHRVPSDYSGASAGEGGLGPVGNSTPAYLPPPPPPLAHRSSSGGSGVSGQGPAVPGTFPTGSSNVSDGATGVETDHSRGSADAPGATPAVVVQARIRRDGTITRRGVDHDFEQAESEQLPPYTEME